MDGHRHLRQNNEASKAAEPHALFMAANSEVRPEGRADATDGWSCAQGGQNFFMDDETTATTAKDAAPYFDVHIFVCCNRRPDGHARGSCAARGSEALRDYMKARVKEARIPNARVNMAGCLDRCEDGPCIVIYPEGVWYRIENRSDVDAIIDLHLIGGGRAEALRLPAGKPA